MSLILKAKNRPTFFEHWLSGWASLLDAILILFSFGWFTGDCRYHLAVYRMRKLALREQQEKNDDYAT